MDESSPIFKLNIDCFHEIFEWLPIHDLISFGKTCRRLQQVAGDIYRSNYVSKRIIAEGGYKILHRELSIFIPYIEKISICGNNLKVYDYVGTKCKSLREIRLGNNLSEDAIECLKNLLTKVELIEMNECILRQEFYESFLKYCSQIKNLSVKRSYRNRNKSIIIGTNNDWLLQKYPTLKHIELTELYELENELKTFFELNPNVRTFSTDLASLEANRNFFLSSSVKLEKLSIEFSGKIESKSVLDLLQQLHAQEFFKMLHIYFKPDSTNDFLHKILSTQFSSTIEALNFEFSWLPMENQLLINQTEVYLKNLKVLGINNVNNIINMDVLPNKLPNLEKIYFGDANEKVIWPFICGSAKLKTIKILNLVHPDGIYSYREFPNINKMNEKRKMLEGARKVAIYISDNLVLISKWAKKATNLDLIELRRFDSPNNWNDLNSNFRHNHSKHYF